jgi:hypothetical protein
VAQNALIFPINKQLTGFLGAAVVQWPSDRKINKN